MSQSPKLIPICLAALTIWSFGENHLELASTVCKRDSLDLAVDNTDHDSVFSIKDCFCCPGTDSGRKYTVIRAWFATTLDMSGNSYANLTSDNLVDLICDLIGNRRIFLCSCFEFFFVFFLRKFCIFFGNYPFGNGKDRKTLACFVAFLDCFADLLDVVRNLRNQIISAPPAIPA